MRYNKILSVAIATALSTSINMAYAVDAAGDFELMETPIGTAVAAGKETTPIKFASELFPKADQALIDDATPANVGYTVEYWVDTTISTDINVIFTLTEGSWKGNLDSPALNIPTCVDGGACPPGFAPTLVENGEDGQNSVMFLVPLSAAGTSLEKDGGGGGDKLEFSFVIKDSEGVFAKVGSQIGLDVSFPAAANQSVQAQPAVTTLGLATSVQGVDIQFSKDDTPGGTFIDVTQDSKLFMNGVTDDNTTARLGYMDINAGTGVNYQNVAYNFADNAQSATLTITNGIFSASKGTLSNVFLDVNDDGIYNADDGDIAADFIDDTEAKFELDSLELHNDDGTGDYPQDLAGAANPVGIVVKVNGIDEIKSSDDPARATLVVKYDAQDKVYQRRLSHIKRNGTRCKVYNIPYAGARDRAFIRITNKTSGMEGLIKGTLRHENGNVVASDKGPDGTTFTDVDLLGGSTVAVNNTAIIKNDDIAALATEEWTGRATLEVTSNLTNMELMGLLRNATGVVGPLMNASTGADGNSCED